LSKTDTLSFLQGSVAILFRWSWNFVVLRGRFIQDTAYQLLSKSVKYCRSYNKKIFRVFYASPCRFKYVYWAAVNSINASC